MPLRVCDYAACSRPVERTFGSCIICSSHFCSTHVSAPHHVCPSADDDQDAYYAAYDRARKTHVLEQLVRIDARALIAAASALRNGVPCCIPALAMNGTADLDWKTVSAQMGGQNCNLDIEYDDGVVWMVRIRLDDPSLPPKDTQAYIFLSEAYTLKWLHDIGFPAPNLFHFALEGPSNPVGVTYLIMEKLEGKAFDWQSATSTQKRKVMDQLVDIFLLLERHPFRAAGSINSIEEFANIGSFAQPLMFDSPRNALGPFETLQSSLEAVITLQKKMITNGELSTLAQDHYLSFLWRASKIPNVASYCKDAEFFLKHFDDKGDHIMVDEKGNITGIIDWEFASAEPKELAFSSPCMMWPVGPFFDGDNQLSAEEVEFADMFERRGRKDMADIVRNGRGMQRFTYFNGGGIARDYDEFAAMFQGLRRAWMDGAQGEIASYEVWKGEALKRFADDEGLRVLGRERTSS